MQVLEKFIQSKTGNLADCEDAIFISRHFVAIIDGATSKSTQVIGAFGGQKSGKVASTILASTMQTLDPNINAAEAFAYLNKALKDFYIKNDIAELMHKAPELRPTASIAIFSNAKREIWQLGDVQAMVDDIELLNAKKIDVLMAELRSYLLELELAQGKTISELMQKDTARDIVYPLIAKQMQLQNVNRSFEYEYFVLDGFYSGGGQKITRLAPNTKHIILASDGYPKLLNTLAKSEEHLRQTLQQDPLCYKVFKSTKGVVAGNVSFDDRSYIKMEF